MIRAALRSSSHRGVVHRGWAHLDITDDPNIITVDDTSHDWLLPQMTAAVHHCGAGTTGAVLRAGLPSVPVPGIMDQPFWARRLHRLGTATEPIARTALTAESLGHAIDDAVTTTGHRTRAHELSRHLATEDGAEMACAVVEQLLSALRGARG